jgi:RHS repeat-associated protein
MYDAKGEKTWEADLDIYGKVRTFAGRSLSDCPFRYQGQYEDSETGLYYNRFRYYDPNIGGYISQDPIGLEGGFKMYSYVINVNDWIDVFGLKGTYVFIVDDKNKIAYAGKGKWSRFRKSVRQRTSSVFGKVTKPDAWASKYYGNDDIAEMVEAKVIEKLRSQGYTLKNEINSPGLNKLKKVGQATEDLIDKAADDLISEMNKNKGADIKKEKHHH